MFNSTNIILNSDVDQDTLMFGSHGAIHCSLVITCWERADLLALLCVVYPCVYVVFPNGVPGQVWYLIVSIPYICLLPDIASVN